MANLLDEQQAHREAFGKAISRWMKQNNWSQQVTDDYGEEVGQPGPHNSQVSMLQNGRLDPKARLWICLAEFNRAVAEQDLKPIKDRKLKDRLTNAQAFLLDNGKPARASDFFGMFIGEIPIPAAYQHEAVPASLENDLLRKHFLEGAKARGLDPEEAMPLMLKTISLPTTERKRLRKVLAGWDEYSAVELADGLLMASLKGWATEP